MFIEKILVGLMVVLGVSFSALGQKINCNKVGTTFQRKLCSVVENNKASYIKELMEGKSGQNSLERVHSWTRDYYDCLYCEDEPGFRGGSMLRKVVFEDALTVAFFFVYEARVEMNKVERDGRTLVNWLQDDTEKAFDAAFETENEQDKRYLIKQIQINRKYFNIFRNNGAKFRSELRRGGSKF